MNSISSANSYQYRTGVLDVACRQTDKTGQTALSGNHDAFSASSGRDMASGGILNAAKSLSLKMGSSKKRGVSKPVGNHSPVPPKAGHVTGNVAASCLTGAPAVACAVSEITTPVSGGIRSNDEAVELANMLVDEFYATDGDHDVKSSAFFDFLIKKFGYDAHPKLVSKEEFDRMEQTQMTAYRGLNPGLCRETGEEIGADKMINEFKHGKLFSGGSVGGYLYGRGTYASLDKSVADFYVDGDDGGACMKMILPDNCIVGKYGDSNYRYVNEDDSAGAGYIYDDFRDFMNHPELSEKVKPFFGDVDNMCKRETGGFAVLKGYDAYLAQKNGYGDSDYMYILILNRGKLVMPE